MSGSFAKAAERCSVSQQGISMAIKRMENELSCKLFERSRKGIALTDHARYLLPAAERIIRVMDNCDAYFASGMGEKPELHIALTWGAPEEFAEAPLEEFKRENPDVYLNVRHDHDTGCEAAVSAHEAEFALSAGPVELALYDAQFLCASRYGIVARRDGPFAGRESVDMADLDGVPLIVMREYQKTFHVLSAAAESTGVRLNVQERVDSTLLTHQYDDPARAGITTQSLAARFASAKLVFLPFRDPPLDWELYLIKLRGGELSPLAAELERRLLAHRPHGLR
jgi:DNA-binding transcriptional LysR family regulator